MAMGKDDNAKFSLTQNESDKLESYARSIGLNKINFRR